MGPATQKADDGEGTATTNDVLACGAFVTNDHGRASFFFATPC